MFPESIVFQSDTTVPIYFLLFNQKSKTSTIASKTLLFLIGYYCPYLLFLNLSNKFGKPKCYLKATMPTSKHSIFLNRNNLNFLAIELDLSN